MALGQRRDPTSGGAVASCSGRRLCPAQAGPPRPSLALPREGAQRQPPSPGRRGAAPAPALRPPRAGQGERESVGLAPCRLRAPRPAGAWVTWTPPVWVSVSLPWLAALSRSRGCGAGGVLACVTRPSFGVQPLAGRC